MSRSTRLPEALTPLFAVITLPVGILAGLFVGLEAAAAVFVVGWLLLVPASAILFGEDGTTGVPADEIEEAIELAEKAEALRSVRSGDEAGSAGRDPIERLRERYAAGEIDEIELERRLAALLELEDLDADDETEVERAIERIAGARAEASPDAEVEPE